ncbi:uncharacterized protein [Amphiura filiformis]|uniref:uncharacterized protein n=1 Tax=Amphiura filiformis TaxID=82378 RepID=UPI003B227C4C
MESFTCTCNTGYYGNGVTCTESGGGVIRNPITGSTCTSCTRNRIVRLTVVVVRVAISTPAVFTPALNNPSSPEYQLLVVRVTIVFQIYCSRFVGCIGVVIIGFFPGSIGVDMEYIFEEDSPVTGLMVMETILDTGNENDDDIGDNLFITPTATRVNDLCPPNFCSNGGTCISDTEAVTGFCLCPDGFGGIDCTDIVPVGEGDGGNETEICPVDFCQNGGTCQPDPTTNVSTCQCASQFIGSRCEMSLEEDIDNDVILAMIFIVDALMMVAIIIAISLICFCVVRRRRMQHRRITFQPVDTPWSIAVRNRTDGLY